MKDRDTPLAIVRMWPKAAADCYDHLDRCRAEKDDGTTTWPDYCLLPINAAAIYLVNGKGVSPEVAAAMCAELTACWTWRQNKVIYAFDPDMAAVLAEQAEDVQDNDVLPADLLMRLPYPCVYIKAPGLLEHIDGFWAWVDYDTNRCAPELRIQWVLEGMSHSLPTVLHIVPGGTLKDCFLDTAETTAEHGKTPVDVTHPADSSRPILAAIQLILYLLAENADIEDVPPPVRAVRDPANKKVIDIIRDKAGEVQEKAVGIRIGAAIRRAKSRPPENGEKGEAAADGSEKQPHMRRGHWLDDWTGPKDGDRKHVLKWTAPTMINAEDGADNSIVIRPEKPDKK